MLYDFAKATWSRQEYNQGLAKANEWLERCRASGTFKEDGARRDVDASIQLAIAWARLVRADENEPAERVQEFGFTFWSKLIWNSRISLQAEDEEVEDV